MVIEFTQKNLGGCPDDCEEKIVLWNWKRLKQSYSDLAEKNFNNNEIKGVEFLSIAHSNIKKYLKGLEKHSDFNKWCTVYGEICFILNQNNIDEDPYKKSILEEKLLPPFLRIDILAGILENDLTNLNTDSFNSKLDANKIRNLFKNHPKFPFLYWHKNYDEYTAMYLCLTNLLKAYIPEKDRNDWTHAYDFIDFRRNPDGEVAYPLMCINSKLELVINLGPRKLDENEIDESFFSVQVTRDDRWGDKWMNNAPEDEWYNEVSIMFDFNNAASLEKIDSILNKIMQKKLSYNELLILEE